MANHNMLAFNAFWAEIYEVPVFKKFVSGSSNDQEVRQMYVLTNGLFAERAEDFLKSFDFSKNTGVEGLLNRTLSNFDKFWTAGGGVSPNPSVKLAAGSMIVNWINRRGDANPFILKLGLDEPLADAVEAEMKYVIQLSQEDSPPGADLCSMYHGQVTEVGAAFEFSKLVAIDEANYIFEADFVLTLTWQEDRVRWLPNLAGKELRACARTCSGKDKCCDNFWFPDLLWPNADMSIEMRSLTADDKGLEYAWNSTTRSFDASRKLRVVARFTSPMDFHKFPNDHQFLFAVLQPR